MATLRLAILVAMSPPRILAQEPSQESALGWAAEERERERASVVAVCGMAQARGDLLLQSMER